jgi:DNA-binding response OmpR family regulator
MKVLFVQEEPLLATALKLTLQKEGYEVNFCKNATEAVKALNAYHPDLLIADIMLYQKRKQLSSGARRKKIPVILLGSSSSEEQLQLAFDLEADDYAALPLSLPELSLRVNKLTHYKKHCLA